MVFAHAYVFVGMMLGAALAHDDVAGNHLLTAKDFDPQSFTFRFATVLYFAFPLLVCHDIVVLRST
jgi:hypothetical protein